MLKNSLAKTKHREAWLDIAKAFGIALVVYSHLHLDVQLISFFGGMIVIPIFFVTAGYTYRNKGESIKDYVLGKAKRLLIPYAVCNVFLFVFFTILNRSFSKPSFLGLFYGRSMLMKNGSIWNMAMMSNLNAPTWFLPCMFLCLYFYYLIDCKFTDVKKRRIAIVIAMAVGILIRTVSPVLMPWGIENALFFLGLLEVGRFLKEEGLTWLRKNEWIYANFLIGFVALSYLNGSVNVSISEYGRSMILYFFTGALGSILCMKAAELTEKYLKVLVRPMAFIGRHTMEIMCWHLFALEIIRKVLAMLGI